VRFCRTPVLQREAAKGRREREELVRRALAKGVAMAAHHVGEAQRALNEAFLAADEAGLGELPSGLLYEALLLLGVAKRLIRKAEGLLPGGKP